MKHAPILMADVVRSGHQQSNQLARGLKKLVEQAQQEFGHSILSPLTITLGDEFQGVVRNLNEGLRLMIWFEEQRIVQELPFTLRMILHVGEIHTPINRSLAHGMMGPGLTKARESLLEMKKKTNRFLVSGLSVNPSLESLLNHSFIIYQTLVESWTPREKELVALFLKEDNYQKVAQLTGKSPSTSWRRRRSLGFEAYLATKYIIHHLPDSTARKR